MNDVSSTTVTIAVDTKKYGIRIHKALLSHTNEDDVALLEKVTPNFALPNDIVLPLRFPSLKPVAAQGFQLLTSSTVATLTNQP